MTDNHTNSETLLLTTSEEDIESFRDDVIQGLGHAPNERRLPSRYLYDRKGSELFEAICDTPEYYLTRTELRIMRQNASSIAEVLGPRCRIVELGSGASIKTQLLLDRLDEPAAYYPVDISPDYLRPACERLRERYPDLRIEPVCANFAAPFQVPHDEGATRTIVYFPGSTIGNFTRPAAVSLMQSMRDLALGDGDGGVLLGVDLKKDRDTLEAAYNDADGVTARFTANYLTRMVRELEADIDPSQFEHLARYNPELGRIEIYLHSLADQRIAFDDHSFAIAESELINTEYSYKYSLADVQELANRSGLALTQAWLDQGQLVWSVLSIRELNSRYMLRVGLKCPWASASELITSVG